MVNYLSRMPPASTSRTRLLDAMIDTIWEHSYGTASVEAICERADVRKGSFYHFFKSKTALAIAAIDHLWETHSRPTLDSIFSPSRPPLARLERMLEHWYQQSLDCMHGKGRVLGCPYFSLGAETAADETELNSRIRQILNSFQGYLEACLREANNRGEIDIDDPAATAASLFCLAEGCNTQARIHNDPERVRHLADAFRRVIGANLKPDLESVEASL